MKCTCLEYGYVSREKKNMPGERDCSVCPTFFFRTPVGRHAVMYHFPWFGVPACGHARSSMDLASTYTSTVWKRRRERSRRTPKMHQVFGACHMVHWCELGLEVLQQLADLVSGGNLGAILAW